MHKALCAEGMYDDSSIYFELISLKKGIGCLLKYMAKSSESLTKVNFTAFKS